MRTMKVKLPFPPATNENERLSKLLVWAKSLMKCEEVKIIEEKHLSDVSYIVFENTSALKVQPSK